MLGVVVIGAGRIGQIHAANVAANPAARLVSVVDPLESAAQSLAGRLGCEAAADPLAEIARPDVDAVVVGAPTDMHVPLTLAAIGAGKAVLCEKPLDLDFAKAEAALVEIDRKHARVMLAFNRRFDPSAMELHRAVTAGEIGAVRQVIITSRDPTPPPPDYIRRSGGIFRDMLIHDFDMARWLLGEDPTEVYAVGNCLVDPHLAELDDFDSTMVVMRTSSGRQCHINTCRQAAYGHDQRIEVFGEKGMLLNDHIRPHTVQHYGEQATAVRAPLLNFFLERYERAYRAEMDAFLNALVKGSPMPVTPEDAVKALHLADCALQSVKAHRAMSTTRS